jgi:hypothetical protein
MSALFGDPPPMRGDVPIVQLRGHAGRQLRRQPAPDDFAALGSVLEPGDELGSFDRQGRDGSH